MPCNASIILFVDGSSVVAPNWAVFLQCARLRTSRQHALENTGVVLRVVEREAGKSQSLSQISWTWSTKVCTAMLAIQAGSRYPEMEEQRSHPCFTKGYGLLVAVPFPHVTSHLCINVCSINSETLSPALSSLQILPLHQEVLNDMGQKMRRGQ